MRLSAAITALLLCCTTFSLVYSLAVMSVDLGSEWIKIGIVSPGVPMEIALNKESKRKTPAVISIRNDERMFGEDAQTLGVRFPKQAYFYLLDLLGKNINHPLVKLFQQRFPYYEIIADPERDTILFKHDDSTVYSPEELIAQFLAKAKEFAEIGAQQPIKECVITVPGYFNQVERKVLLQSAQLAGLKVLQLINDYTAVALNYGIFRSKTFNETAQYIMFYDMGASSTTVTLVSYQTTKTKEKGFVETHPQVTVLGVGYDRTLGGLEIQIRLRDYLAKKFNEMKKTKNDVTKNPRSMAKLLKEAGRLKNILSANAEYHAQVEGLIDEIDFKLPVKREDLENLIPDLLDRASKPVEMALNTAHLTLDVISQIVLVGAGTRVPKIQEILQKATGKELAKNINADEAAALGAVYKAADLSSGFKVAKFITKDAVLFPIQVTFDREIEDGSIKSVKRTLFSLMNPYPQKKLITFNKHKDDFTFNVNYAELDHLPPDEVANIGSKNLSVYKLTGVAEALKKNTGENMESKGIKAHFSMDDSGILNLINVELVVEKTVVVAEEEEGAFSKLGSTFSKLFGGDDQPDVKPVHEKPYFEQEEENNQDELKANKTKEDNVSNKNATNTKQNATDTSKEPNAKIVTVKIPIETEENILTVPTLDDKKLAASAEKLRKLEKIEKDHARRASALNNLESFVIDVQTKLDEEEFAAAANQKEIEQIRSACSEVSDWLYEDEASVADAEEFEKKLDHLQSLTRDLFARVWEHKERPDALNALHSMLNNSAHFLHSAKNLTVGLNEDKGVFTDVEVESLEKIIKETTEWRDKMVKEQEQQQKSDPIKLTVKSLMDKMAALDREVKYLVNKIKMWRPKKSEKPNKDKAKKEDNDTKKENNDTKKENGEKVEEIVIEEETPKEQIQNTTQATNKSDHSEHSEL